MGRLFGTDGARGIANSELTCELAMEIGRAAAMVLTKQTHKKPKVLIGMDTRASSQMLESAITAGLCSVGADVMLLGEIPTPAVAYLVKKYEYDAAVMISASHNPCEYNGIKIFQGTGFKLPDALEEEIEAIILDKAQVPPIKVGGQVGRVTRAITCQKD
jgi:phosphoglucosamine mutase